MDNILSDLRTSSCHTWMRITADSQINFNLNKQNNVTWRFWILHESSVIIVRGRETTHQSNWSQCHSILHIEALNMILPVIWFYDSWGWASPCILLNHVLVCAMQCTQLSSRNTTLNCLYQWNSTQHVYSRKKSTLFFFYHHLDVLTKIEQNIRAS